MTDRHQEIQNSYKQLGNIASLYDGIITRSTVIGKIMDSVIWGHMQIHCRKTLAKVLKIPGMKSLFIRV